MPIREFVCPACQAHQEEIFLALDPEPESLPCKCGGRAVRVLSVPRYYLRWRPAPFDADAWEGTPLEGTDGVNEEYYKSTKVQVDMGTD